jgi:uncharacterized protein HemX
MFTLSKELLNMKKSLTSLFALAFVLMFGMVHVASAQKHMAPAAKTEGAAAAEAKKEMTKEEKKEMKKEKKMKKKAAKKKDEMKEAAPAAPAPAPAK